MVGAGSSPWCLVLLLAKGLALCASAWAAAYRGGPIFPAIFLGVGLAAVAVVVLGTSPTLAVAVGAAAGMAAQTRLLFSSVLLAALLVGPNGADAVPAAVMAATAAWLAAAMLPARLSPAPRT